MRRNSTSGQCLIAPSDLQSRVIYPILTARRVLTHSTPRIPNMPDSLHPNEIMASCDNRFPPPERPIGRTHILPRPSANRARLCT